MNQGILLYGPPAAGKDTVTGALVQLDSRYALFSRLKIGSGKSAGYRMGTPDQLAELERRGDLIYRNDRYGNTYVVDRQGLGLAMEGGRIPILHLGQVAGVEAVTAKYSAAWSTVLMWCSREATAIRSTSRGDRDTEARLAAWDATEKDLATNDHPAWDLRVDTEVSSPGDAAVLIDQLVRESV
ncbi:MULTISPECIES: guanylate kinase [unclassified Streptomyces]|uniref:guanylate kinase n=1 Tax=unclassified Streptomyces TaxID=2593676 RepID=UPI000CD57B0A|nr:MULTISPECIES: guanylate kinase [unclassified Streptomyces]